MSNLADKLRARLAFDEDAFEKKWDLIRKEEEIGQEDFISPGYHTYENGILALGRWQSQQNADVISAMIEAITELSKVRPNAYFTALEMSAWLGIPEKKRERYVKEFVDNMAYMPDKALAKLEALVGKGEAAPLQTKPE